MKNVRGDFTGQLALVKYGNKVIKYIYDGKNWLALDNAKEVGAPNIANLPILKSCKYIKQFYPNAEDGVYTIDPDGEGGNAPFKAYCDMTTDGGGWTLVAKRDVSSDVDIKNSAPIGTINDKTYKLATYTINMLFANSNYWLIQGSKSGKRVKISTKVSNADNYNDLGTILIGNGTWGCGPYKWDGKNYIDMDHAGNKCWAYPLIHPGNTSTTWYDMTPNGNGSYSDRSGVTIYLR